MFGSKLLIILCLLLLAGCCKHAQLEDFDTDRTMDVLKMMRTINATSAPLNPLALPIGAGLSGIILMLESLRRVEKGKRKYAEHELNNNSKHNS